MPSQPGTVIWPWLVEEFASVKNGEATFDNLRFISDCDDELKPHQIVKAAQGQSSQPTVEEPSPNNCTVKWCDLDGFKTAVHVDKARVSSQRYRWYHSPDTIHLFSVLLLFSILAEQCNGRVISPFTVYLCPKWDGKRVEKACKNDLDKWGLNDSEKISINTDTHYIYIYIHTLQLKAELEKWREEEREEKKDKRGTDGGSEWV